MSSPCASGYMKRTDGVTEWTYESVELRVMV